MATFFVILFLETNVGITFDIFSKAQRFFLRYSGTVSEKYYTPYFILFFSLKM